MKLLEILACAAALFLRLIAVPAREWPGDWIVVLTLLWGAWIATDGRPRLQAWAGGLGAAWFLALYAIHQGPHSFHAF
jgi:hypothetical protein